MTVCCLISAPGVDTYGQCTLTLNTLRVGFPTAKVLISVSEDSVHRDEIYRRCTDIRADIHEAYELHHADWIRNSIEFLDGEAPLVIVDPDMIFWKDCEWFDHPNALLAGMGVPDHWNHWSNCAYRSRLHTSFLWIRDPRALLNEMDTLWHREHNGPYLPCDLFRPVITYDFGRPTFYDTMAILCHALPREKMAMFGPEHLDCYDHLNSASFFHEMQKRWSNDEQRAEFARIHKLAVEDPQQLRGLWKKTLAYYTQQHVELMKRTSNSGWNGTQEEKVLRVSAQ